MRKNKVGIITLYHFIGVIFGNKYQNYACEEIFEKLGCLSETLIREKPFPAVQLIKYRAYRLLNYLFGYRLSANQSIWKRYILFRKFEKKYLHIRYVPSKNLGDTAYDFYSIGSDQVWNPNWTFTPEDIRWYFCTDVPAEKYICLSPSFGVDNMQDENRETYARCLNRFEHLSTREETGREIIRDLTGKDAPVLIDPTLALSKTEWDLIQKKPCFV